MDTFSKDIAKLQNKLSLCNDVLKQIKIIASLADKYTISQQYYLGKEWGEKLFNLASEKKLSDYIALSCNIIGRNHIGLSEFDHALDCYLKALQIYRELKDNSRIAVTLNLIGVVYGRTHNIDKAFDCFSESITYNDKQHQSLGNIGMIYLNKNDYHNALKYLHSSLKLAKAYGTEYEVLMSEIYIANTYLRMSDYDKAISNFERLLKTHKDFSDKYLFVKIYIGISKAFHIKGDLQKSLEYVRMAEDVTEQIKNKSMLKASYEIISESYEDMKECDTALKYYKKHFELSNSIFTDKLALGMAQIQEKHEREKKDLEQSYQAQLFATEQEMNQRLEKLHELYSDIAGLSKIGFFSDKMDKIYLLTDKLHNDRSIPVLIEGETGTGKEIVARLIHFGKNNSTIPFISINCSAITPSLFETELFGYEGGAFTGSKQKGMPGKLELANGGTIFLDEIGDLPLEMQPKLLRVLQEKEMYRIGGIKKINLDVRVICATNQNLSMQIEQGSFRADLFYRLNTAHISIPPLRDRKEEIIPLAQMFLKRFAAEKKKKFKFINKDTQAILESRDWKGNIRELENAIEMAVMLYDDTNLKPQHLINEFSEVTKCWHTQNNIVIPINEDKMLMDNIELEIVKQLLKRFNGNKSKTADYLGVSRKTIGRKLAQSDKN